MQTCEGEIKAVEVKECGSSAKESKEETETKREADIEITRDGDSRMVRY